MSNFVSQESSDILIRSESKSAKLPMNVTEDKQDISSGPTIADPQVKTSTKSKPRRSFSQAYKDNIIKAYDACPDSSARGALLRREGLYHSRISTWRAQGAAGKTKTKKKSVAEAAHFKRENDQLKKQLAQAHAIIDIQKKVSQLLGITIPPQDNSEVK